MPAVGTEKKLSFLKTRECVDLSLNDIRIIVGCFRAVAYREEVDNEEYLDADSLELKQRLEILYNESLKELGAPIVRQV
jgi:hypothetical protein